MNLAPIILFVYNRPWHTVQTLEALTNNPEAKESLLYIYADGPKENATDEDLKNIKQTKEVLRKKQWCKEVKIIESETNKGLANSIVSGVTEVINSHGKVIVLEDDIVSSPGFLRYMNEALIFYQNEQKIMHVSGYMFPIERKLPNTFFSRLMLCWGWGTWSRSWSLYNNDINEIKKRLITTRDRFRFNLGDALDYYQQVEDNLSGKLKTWAVKWYASIYFNKGLCLNPGHSLIRNIGVDGTGENCGISSIYDIEQLVENVSVNQIPICDSKKAIGMIRQFQNPKKTNNNWRRYILLTTKMVIKKSDR